MTDLLVRQATLADTYAITDIHCSNVEGGVFTRRNSDGTRTPVPYESLSLFERYMNGGPWMAVETCAVWLAHMLQLGDEIPLVVEADGMVVGEAEVTIGNEPAPYGSHLTITVLRIHHDIEEPEQLIAALLQYVKEMAQVMHVQRILAIAADPAHGFQPMITRRPVIVAAKEGRVVYKAVATQDFNPRRIGGWYMPFGRHQSARHEWTRIWPGFWNGVPELVEPETSRFDIELAGQQAICLLEQCRYETHRAEAFLWTARPLTRHMVSAVRDRAAREGYQELVLFVDDPHRALVEAEAVEVHDVQMLQAWHVK